MNYFFYFTAADVVERLVNSDRSMLKIENGAEINKHKAEVKKTVSGV